MGAANGTDGWEDSQGVVEMSIPLLSIGGEIGFSQQVLSHQSVL